MASSPICAFVLGVGMSLGGTCEDGAIGQDVQKSASNWMLPQPESRPAGNAGDCHLQRPAATGSSTPPNTPPETFDQNISDLTAGGSGGRPHRERGASAHSVSVAGAPRPLTLTAYQSVYGHGAARCLRYKTRCLVFRRCRFPLRSALRRITKARAA